MADEVADVFLTLSNTHYRFMCECTKWHGGRRGGRLGGWQGDQLGG